MCMCMTITKCFKKEKLMIMIKLPSQYLLQLEHPSSKTSAFLLKISCSLKPANWECYTSKPLRQLGPTSMGLRRLCPGAYEVRIRMSRFKSCHSRPKFTRFGIDLDIQSGPPSQIMVTAFLFSPRTVGCKISFSLLTCMALVLLWNMHSCRQMLSAPDLGHRIRSLPSASKNILPLKLRSHEQ